MNLRIRAAEAGDLPSVFALLAECDLPTADLDEPSLSHFLVAHAEEVDELVGVIGLEPYDTTGLLRSLAVSPRHRGKAIARTLVTALEHRAQDQGIADLYLLTTTADQYFMRRAYMPVDRTDVPTSIQETQEFAGLCPDSAVVMKKDIGAR